MSRIRKTRTKDTSPALVVSVTNRVVDNMLQYDIQIIKQRYTNGRFSHWGTSITASNGFTLTSASCPAGSPANNDGGYNEYHMYMRGSSSSNDNDIITVPSLGWVEKLKVAVEEYNEHMERV